MATANRKSANSKSGLQTVGGVAAGAAAGSLLGPLGAAVGAVVGGIAGANASEMAKSRTVKKLATATKSTVSKGLTGKSRKNAVAMSATGPARKSTGKPGSTDKGSRRKT